eukprot:TRINITY_DN464_c0_g1_i1.p1 TRINITY_DN464_c0_g1~~TRINITY_DN464_c0_g1_i1.p1  ORF type:complete len:240 (-),score=76.44 TRINITY_DN464_c0_g1_i1:29-748(-)
MSSKLYIPGYTLQTENEQIQKLINENSFALLISTILDANLQPITYTTHVPCLLRQTPIIFNRENDEQKLQNSLGFLHLHVAKANPHWRAIEANPNSEHILVFNGPHCYISPNYYATQDNHVPTWNYAVVHVKGFGKTVHDNETKLRIVSDLVESSEIALHNYDPNHQIWQLYSHNTREYLDKELRGIVAIEICITKFDAKFKLSQNATKENFNRVKTYLEQSNSQQVQQVAHLMQNFQK